jgi:hypothetical protein
MVLARNLGDERKEKKWGGRGGRKTFVGAREI